MRKLLTIVPFFFGFGTFAQDSLKTELELVWSMPLDETSVWDNDDAGNIYLFRNQAIVKLDSNGRQLLTQSTKSIGQVAKIDASNWMKIALFSEEQQQICYLDNALGILPDCIELSELGINLAQNFSASAQTDRIWVYDQLNSELQIITLRTNQRQIVQNLSGLAEISSVSDMTEYGNTLMLMDAQGKVLLFDNFGSLQETFATDASCFFPYDHSFFFIKEHQLYFQLPDQPLLVGEIPVKEEILKFVAVQGKLIIGTATTLYSFRVSS